MDLLEYQAKELFRQVGIPTLPSQTIHQLGDLKHLQIPYPLVLKSQVRAGGRGKAGGVKFVENTIDAIAAASAIYHLPIAGEYPEVVLAEARYNSQLEFFLAIVLDYQRQCPLLLGSSRGGIDVEILLEHIQSVPLSGHFSPFYARRLVIQMGLTGELVTAVSQIIEKMYVLFVRYDLDLIEINPLGVDGDGRVMALDGKIVINDTAIARHGDLQAPLGLSAPSPLWRCFPGQVAEGEVVIISNSKGIALNSWDLVQAEEQTLVFGAYVLEERSQGENLIKNLEKLLQELQKNPHLRVILIHLFLAPEQVLDFSQNFLLDLRSTPAPTNEDRLMRATGTLSPPPPRKMLLPLTIPLVICLPSSQELPAGDGLPLFWHSQLPKAIAAVGQLTAKSLSTTT